jgi:hypothetical protein
MTASVGLRSLPGMASDTRVPWMIPDGPCVWGIASVSEPYPLPAALFVATETVLLSPLR